MRPRLAVAAATALALLAFSAAAGVVVVRQQPADAIAAAAAPYGYNLPRWEMRHLLGRWLYQLGGYLRGGRGGDDDASLRRYFGLREEAGRLEQRLASGDDEALAELRKVQRQGRALENRVERILEERVARVLSGQGLATSPPLFDDISFVFPPVDTELGEPPQVLIISPRERILLERVYLLRPDMALEEVLRLEGEAGATGVSALVDATAGVASYPSVVGQDLSYDSALQLVAHEWVHHYLFFYPLGRRYFQSEEMRTINETVANIVGREVASLARQRSPAPGATGVETDLSLFNREMRQLRLAVDELLAQGKVEEAEALMEEKQRFLAQQGFYIRKINQAFFAFHGTYADTAAASSPLGPKVQTVRQRSTSLAQFVRLMSRVSSPQDLDRLLEEMGAPTRP